MLDATPPNIEGGRETAKRALRDANRASEVVARLRALFSKREASLEVFDLNDAMREVIALSSSNFSATGSCFNRSSPTIFRPSPAIASSCSRSC
jgi:hypothetical protein